MPPLIDSPPMRKKKVRPVGACDGARMAPMLPKTALAHVEGGRAVRTCCYMPSILLPIRAGPPSPSGARWWVLVLVVPSRPWAPSYTRLACPVRLLGRAGRASVELRPPKVPSASLPAPATTCPLSDGLACLRCCYLRLAPPREPSPRGSRAPLRACVRACCCVASVALRCVALRCVSDPHTRLRPKIDAR